MYEHYLDAYLNLIQGLLHSQSESKEEEILSDNQELINFQLIEVIEYLIETLTKQGHHQVVADLFRLVKRLREFSGGRLSSCLKRG